MTRAYYVIEDKNGGWYTDSKSKAHLLFKTDLAAKMFIRNELEGDKYDWIVQSIVVIDD